MTAALRLLLRRHRTRILAWVLPLVGLVAISPQMYASTYSDAQQRAVVVEQLRASAGTRLVYGELPLPGGAGQMLVWEVGTYVVMLGCLATMLLALAVTRGEEESGGTELVLTHGTTRAQLLGAGALVVALQVLLLSLGSTAAVSAQVGRAVEISHHGAIALGLAVALSTGLFGALGLLLAQVFPSSGQARSVLFVLLAASFMSRGIGEAQEWGWMRWCSPLGWLQLLSPFTRDRLWAAAWLLPLVLVVAALAFWAGARREFAAGLVASDERSAARARVRGTIALEGLLGRRSLAGWLVGVVGTGAFFASMAKTMTDTVRKDAHTGDLMSKATGGLDPVPGYFSYTAIFLALLACCHVVARVLATRTREGAGLLDPVLATGQGRDRPLRAALLWSGAGGSVMLAAAAGLAVLSAGTLDDPQAWRYAVRGLLGHVPAVLLCAALAALLVGLVPRLAVLAWLPVVVSGSLTLLGPTVDAPRWLVRCSVLSHAPVDHWDARAAATLLALALLAGIIALAAMRRRDVRT